MRTLLFDVDGTLLLTNSGGSSAIKLALEQEFGVKNPRTDINFAGRTDRSLLAELLQQNGLPDTRRNQDRLEARYKQLFPDVLADRGGRLLPGALELLSRLAEASGLNCYVMTGNLHETATRKLQHFGILRFFRGIFGGDHDHDRTDLARRTAAAIDREHGEAGSKDIVVIGDTPADILCGHAIGASVLAVCTGSYSRQQLEAENPMSVHEDFSDVSTVFDLLTQIPSNSNGRQR